MNDKKIENKRVKTLPFWGIIITSNFLTEACRDVSAAPVRTIFSHPTSCLKHPRRLNPTIRLQKLGKVCGSRRHPILQTQPKSRRSLCYWTISHCFRVKSSSFPTLFTPIIAVLHPSSRPFPRSPARWSLRRTRFQCLPGRTSARTPYKRRARVINSGTWVARC